jgi:hypothetical protein
MPMDQEKGEVRLPINDNEDRVTRWADDRSARVKKGTPGREGRHGGDYASRYVDNAVFYNSLPPGSDVDDAEMGDTRVEPLVTAGTSDFSKDTNSESMRTGYTRLHMAGTDEHSTNEHIDPFYKEIEVDGKTAYCERGNVLDRN